MHKKSNKMKLSNPTVVVVLVVLILLSSTVVIFFPMVSEQQQQDKPAFCFEIGKSKRFYRYSHI